MCDQSKHVETLLNNSTMRLSVVNHIWCITSLCQKTFTDYFPGHPHKYWEVWLASSGPQGCHVVGPHPSRPCFYNWYCPRCWRFWSQRREAWRRLLASSSVDPSDLWRSSSTVKRIIIYFFNLERIIIFLTVKLYFNNEMFLWNWMIHSIQG